MNILTRNAAMAALLLLAVQAAAKEATTYYYAAVSKGVTCGYSEITTRPETREGKAVLVMEESTQVKLSIVGAPVSSAIHSRYIVDPKTGQYTLYELTMDQGKSKLTYRVSITGDKARVTIEPAGITHEVPLPAGVILENALFLPHLARDFGSPKVKEKTYLVFDLLDARAQPTRYTRIGVEALTAAGKVVHALGLRKTNLETGEKSACWIRVSDGLVVRSEYSTRTVTLSDASTKEKIEPVAVDENYFVKANAAILDIKAISLLKVKSVLEPIGEWLTPQALNGPGQTFAGKVDENRVLGTFEVAIKPYRGENPPPFPCDYTSRQELAGYLAPEPMIESADPTLAAKARELTTGAGDSWEAARRLARWVADEIGYDIPAGISARNTYDLKAGECGAHSQLMAAFCRTVGIPARVVWGCMYIPNYGGAFGQHAWNEVYMGDAGWIPIDTTAKEIDLVDSGHIRLGEIKSRHINIQLKNMEILDFVAGAQKMGQAADEGAAVPEMYRPFLGSYAGKFDGQPMTFRILFQGGGLAIDIPGQMVMGLKNPDAAGMWLFAIIDTTGVTFDREADGRVTGMRLHNRIRILRKPGEQPVSPDAAAAPEAYRPLVGSYSLPMQGLDLQVVCKAGRLALLHPQDGEIALEGPDEKGRWKITVNQDKLSFERDASGRTTAMILHQEYILAKEGSAAATKEDK